MKPRFQYYQSSLFIDTQCQICFPKSWFVPTREHSSSVPEFHFQHLTFPHTCDYFHWHHSSELADMSAEFEKQIALHTGFPSVSLMQRWIFYCISKYYITVPCVYRESLYFSECSDGHSASFILSFCACFIGTSACKLFKCSHTVGICNSTFSNLIFLRIS